MGRAERRMECIAAQTAAARLCGDYSSITPATQCHVAHDGRRCVTMICLTVEGARPPLTPRGRPAIKIARPSCFSTVARQQLSAAPPPLLSLPEAEDAEGRSRTVGRSTGGALLLEACCCWRRAGGVLVACSRACSWRTRGVLMAHSRVCWWYRVWTLADVVCHNPRGVMCPLDPA